MEAVALVQVFFDILLGLGLIWLAWKALFSSDLLSSIVLFVAFGLLMSLAWVSLNAPDVALAEAAIGAGLTGAMLLASRAKLRSVEKPTKETRPVNKTWQRDDQQKWLTPLLLLPLAAGLGYAVLTLPVESKGLIELVAENLAASGVSNPVTAVLMNFRGYDTMLEKIVLLLALLGIWSLGGTHWIQESEPGPVLVTLSLYLTPALILVAGYLLWVGGHAPGGAFQAGALLGAAGVLLLLTNLQLRPGLTGLPLRACISIGPAVFIAIATLTLVWTGGLLAYPLAQAGTLILVLETAATVSIGVLLAALFWGSPPERKEKP